MGAIRRDIEQIFTYLDEIEYLQHLSKIISYDMETSSPKGGMNDDARDISRLQSEIFKLKKDTEYISNVHKLLKVGYKSIDDKWIKRLIVLLNREVDQSKGISVKLNKEANELFSQAYITWLSAKEHSSYEEFKETLKKITDIEKRLIAARFPELDPRNYYDVLLSDYEFGFTVKDLDVFFDEIEKNVVPLYKAIKKSKYVPRHDFLKRRVPISKQEQFTNYLLKFNGFDFDRGSSSTTEHPFTEQFGKDDVRITTKYIENNFISNMYSVIHEGGHALFGQFIPEEVFTNHLGEGCLSMAKHESVSRFYENVIGRSKEYIHAIYPKLIELFHDELSDVSEEELYEGVNYIDMKNTLRTEADELTYALHIIIRYKLEKEIMNGEVNYDTLNKRWNDLYKEYLGVNIKDDASGILQDVHWSSGFGYFPTYAMGNALNIIYLNKMNEEFSVTKAVKSGKMDTILSWLEKNVFSIAPLYDTKEWIKKITGNEFSAQPYCKYLTDKYMKLYHLTKADLKKAMKED